MSRYAHINLLEIEDSVGGRTGGLVEARFGRNPLESRDLGVSHWRYSPNLKADIGHHHREQEEAYVVVAGSGQILIDDEVRELRQWDVVRLAPETIRAFAAGPDGLELIAIGGPKPEGGDGQTVNVTWPD
jgi:mannose-6-phosphate isomerase-like protein (cupin superfamily)